MKHKVMLDMGVTIGGQRYPHGAIVDSDALVPKYEEPKFNPPKLDDKADDEAKAKHADSIRTLKTLHDENVTQAKAQNEADLKAAQAAHAEALKQGFMEPVKETASTKKEG